jgi:hypothetical protein
VSNIGRTGASTITSNSSGAHSITHASVPVDTELGAANKRPRLTTSAPALVPAGVLPFAPTPTETVIWRTISAPNEIAAPTSVVPTLPMPVPSAQSSNNSTHSFNNAQSAGYSSSAGVGTYTNTGNGATASTAVTAPSAVECSQRWAGAVRPTAAAEQYPEWSQDEVRYYRTRIVCVASVS